MGWLLPQRSVHLGTSRFGSQLSRNSSHIAFVGIISSSGFTMASSSSFAVLLIVVALGGVLAIEAARRPSGTLGWNGKSNDNSLQRMTIPSALLRSIASPLDAERTAQYLAQLQDRTLAQHSQDFCKEARLECRADIAIVDPTLSMSGSALLDQVLFEKTRDLVRSTHAMQFSRNDVTKDREIVLPENLHDSYPTVSFLPQALAEKMPFTSEKMPELLDSLNIPHDSHLANMMSRTVGQCEAQEQGKGTRKCVTSLEDMKNFVGMNLPQDKRIALLHRSSSIPGAGESHSKDRRWKVLDAKLYNRVVVCRNSAFPYAVFLCHDISKTNMRFYSVEMRSRDGKRITEVAACHDNSIAAGSDATVFKNKPTTAAEACHWVTDSLIWAPAN